MRWPVKQSALIARCRIALVACTDDDPPITFDTAPPAPDTTEVVESTSTTSSTTTTVVAGDQVGTEWTLAIGNLAGMPSECQSLNMLAAWPGRDALVAGIALQGLWQSVDGGESWTQLGTGEGSAEIVNRPTSIVFDPDDPDRFWESGLFNSGSVYRTDDAGTTFTQLGVVDYGNYVAVDFSDPERRTLVLGEFTGNQLFRSSDGGQTWADASGNLPLELGDIQSALVIDERTHLIGSDGGPSAGVFRTVDAGASWQRVNEGGISGAPGRHRRDDLLAALGRGGCHRQHGWRGDLDSRRRRRGRLRLELVGRHAGWAPGHAR